MQTKRNKTQQAGMGISELGYMSKMDGIDHINIYSVGQTELGRLLSHFAHTPFTHPYFGPFYSMEGFWYFCRSGFSDDSVRYLSGLRAKKVGKNLPYIWYKEFKEDIIGANYQKIIQNERLLALMIESDLPFDHYYIFGNNDVHITPKSTQWLVEGFEHIRMALKEGVIPSTWLDAEKRYLGK